MVVWSGEPAQSGCARDAGVSADRESGVSGPLYTSVCSKTVLTFDRFLDLTDKENAEFTYIM